MILFSQVEASPVPLFDLLVDGRVLQYDIESQEFSGALRRARVDLSGHKVYVEDMDGYRESLTR